MLSLYRNKIRTINIVLITKSYDKSAWCNFSVHCHILILAHVSNTPDYCPYFWTSLSAFFYSCSNALLKGEAGMPILALRPPLHPLIYKWKKECIKIHYIFFPIFGTARYEFFFIISYTNAGVPQNLTIIAICWGVSVVVCGVNPASVSWFSNTACSLMIRRNAFTAEQLYW